jgi:hypothetical protein
MGQQGIVKGQIVDAWAASLDEMGAKLPNEYTPDPIYYNGKRIPYNSRGPGAYTDNEDWIICLNRYERDNLLALINAIGFPWDPKHPDRVVPTDSTLHSWNSGDWVGMIGYKLADTNGNCYSPGGNWHDENPPTPEEYQSMLRMLAFVRGKLLAHGRTRDEV